MLEWEVCTAWLHIDAAFNRVWTCRCSVQRHFLELKRNAHLQALKEHVAETG